MIKLNRPPCPHPVALINNNYKHPTNKQALKDASNDKCMYCESKISHIDFAHVEHIKPKAIDKFPELEFVWDNLGYACPKCNNAKLNHFYDHLPFIDPYKEDPSDFFFAFGSFIFEKDGCERADITIRIIELNRPDLLEKRMNKIIDIQKALNACHRTANSSLKCLILDELKKESEPDKEYSFFIKALFDKHAA
ncbi:HNH endonuclease [Aquirhabdus sp.]|uniref:HNH endonuclease n=1 Tax=Aquirhabdus sp. TaxID=2824160 RepID=UPI00396CA617